MKKLVIVGGGFAGMRLARLLKKSDEYEITVINSSPNFRYMPAMFRAATGLKLATIDLPLSWICLDIPSSRVRVDTLISLDKKNRVISLLSGKQIHYDKLVIALGSTTSYFGIPGLPDLSFGLKTPAEITRLKKHIHDSLVKGMSDEAKHYVIAGAGPTGVELAGSLGEYLKKTARRHKVSSAHIKIYLVEAGPRVLPQVSATSSAKVAEKLRNLGVEIMVNSAVQAETAHELKTSSGNIKTTSVIWTAGTSNNSFFKENSSEFKLNERGKVIVNKHLMSDKNIYVLGDNAATPSSGLAYIAVKHANFVARHLSDANLVYKEPKPIVVVPVTHNYAVLQYRKIAIHGRLASIIRSFADFVGYADVMGLSKAWSVWSSNHPAEEDCDKCAGNVSL